MQLHSVHSLLECKVFRSGVEFGDSVHPLNGRPLSLDTVQNTFYHSVEDRFLWFNDGTTTRKDLGGGVALMAERSYKDRAKPGKRGGP